MEARLALNSQFSHLCWDYKWTSPCQAVAHSLRKKKKSLIFWHRKKKTCFLMQDIFIFRHRWKKATFFLGKVSQSNLKIVCSRHLRYSCFIWGLHQSQWMKWKVDPNPLAHSESGAAVPSRTHGQKREPHVIRIWLTTWLAMDALGRMLGMPAGLMPWFIAEGLGPGDPKCCRITSDVPG